MKLRWLLLGPLVTASLVPAIAVTAARVLDLPEGAWVRLVSFTPFAALLYLVALLLLLPACLRGRGLWRGTARLLAVAALLGVVVHAYWASGPYLTPSAVASSDQSGDRSNHQLHVMTSNLRYGRADTAQVVELAVRHRVDVLVVEEVTPQALAGLQAAGIRTVFPHSVGKAEPGPRGTMVFSRTPLTKVSRLATGFGSYATDVRLGATADARDTSLHLLAVHPRPPLGAAAQWRADQLVVRQAARGLERPTMVVGDLNATMDHAPMRELVGQGFDDAATQARSRWQPTWPSAGVVSRFGVVVPPLLAIDHILVNHGLRAVRTESYTVDATDHRALVAVLRP